MMRKYLPPALLCVFLAFSVAISCWAMVAVPITETQATSAKKTTASPAGKAQVQTTPAGTASTPALPGGVKTPTLPSRAAGKGPSAGTNATSAEAGTALGQATIVGIVLKSIDARQVCAEDGRVFPVTSSTIVVEQRVGTRMPTAQLLFRDGVLRQIIISK